MRKSMTVIGAIAFCSAMSACSQQPSALRAAAKRLSAANTGTMELCATGKSYEFPKNVASAAGESEFDISNFTASVDYKTPSARVQIKRRQSFEPGTLHPFPAESKADQFVSESFAWALETPADATTGAVPSSTAQQGAVEERIAEIWSFPQGFLREAMKNKATAKPTDAGTEIRFTTHGLQFIGTLNDQNEVVRVQTWVHDSDGAPTLIETTYSDYTEDFANIDFPRHIVRSHAGRRVLELTVCSLRTNSAVEIAVPKAVEIAASTQSAGGLERRT